MKFDSNICVLLLSTLLTATACQTTKIPNVKFYAEIPFKDCPEGVYVESLTKKTGMVKCEDWAKIKPFMIMIDPDGKKEIFGQWSQACRWAGQKKCNVQLDSVKKTVEALDAVAGKVIPILNK